MFEDVGISRITIQEFQRTVNVEPAGRITLALDSNFLLLFPEKFALQNHLILDLCS